MVRCESRKGLQVWVVICYSTLRLFLQLIYCVNGALCKSTAPQATLVRSIYRMRQRQAPSPRPLRLQHLPKLLHFPPQVLLHEIVPAIKLQQNIDHIDHPGHPKHPLAPPLAIHNSIPTTKSRIRPRVHNREKHQRRNKPGIGAEAQRLRLVSGTRGC